MDSKIPPELLALYRKSIPGKVADLKNLIDDLQKKRGKEEMEKLRFAVHKLAGNSGTYGFMEVSRLCREAEEKLGKMIAQGAIDSHWVQNLDQFLKGIEQGFEIDG